MRQYIKVWIVFSVFGLLLGLPAAARADVIYDFFGTMHLGTPSPTMIAISFPLLQFATSTITIPSSDFGSVVEGGGYAGDFSITDITINPRNGDNEGSVTVDWDWLISSPPALTSYSWCEVCSGNPFPEPFVGPGIYYDLGGDASLTITPEPSSVILFSTALLAVALVARKRFAPKALE